MKFLITKLKLNIQDNKKYFDFIMAITIFALALLELLSLYKWSYNNKLIPVQYWDTYALNDYPVYNAIGYLIVAIFFYAKIRRYKSCVTSKIITYLYLFIQLASTYSIVFKTGSEQYMTVVYPVILMAIIITIIIKIILWLGRKQR